MSIWLLISIGCMFKDSNFKEIKYCEADRQMIFTSKDVCVNKMGLTDRCIEFKKGQYWITYPITARMGKDL